MTEEHYKQAYDKEYNHSKRLIQFIEALESQSDNWDLFCDCNMVDTPGHHKEDCMTVKIRLDFDKAMSQEKQPQNDIAIW